MKSIINVLFFLVSSLLLSFVLFSCDDGDTPPSVINLIAPAEGMALKIGSEVHFDMELFDNGMLASYKVVIHDNFDGHEHSRAESTTPFYFQKIWDASGQKNAKIHPHEIVILENSTPVAIFDGIG